MTRAIVLPISVVVIKRVGCLAKSASSLPTRLLELRASSIPNLSALKKAASIPEKKAEKLRAPIIKIKWKGSTVSKMFLYIGLVVIGWAHGCFLSYSTDSTLTNPCGARTLY